MAAAQARTAVLTTTTEQRFDGAAWINQVTRWMRVDDDLAARKNGLDALAAFIDASLKPGQTVQQDVETNIKVWLNAIDRKLTAQLNEIIHHSDYQKLEGTWRGLHYLVYHSELGENLKIRVLNATKDEMRKDLENAVEFDQSELFKKVYEGEYGVLGGHPFGLLMGDYDYDCRRSIDVRMLSNLSGVAAAAHAPFIASVNPKSFNMESFAELSNPRDLAKIFSTVDYAPWQSFRESEDSKYVALTMPRVLARLPYSENFERVEEFRFEEDVDGTDHDKYQWMSSAWCYATRVTGAFAKDGWLARTRGVEGGGKVVGLPVHTFPTDVGDVAMKCPTEIAITDRREAELSGLGFLPLIHCKNRDFAAFMGAQSCQKPVKYQGAMGDYATSNAALTARINQLLCVSRFAHFLKVMVRNRIGTFMEQDRLQNWLNEWIRNYVLPMEAVGNVDDDERAKKPLLSARIEVKEVPGAPGYYKALAYLRPHFQLEGLEISLRLVAKQLTGS